MQPCQRVSQRVSRGLFAAGCQVAVRRAPSQRASAAFIHVTLFSGTTEPPRRRINHSCCQHTLVAWLQEQRGGLVQVRLVVSMSTRTRVLAQKPALS